MTIEKSSAMPSIFSIYGIHGLPTIVIVNKMSRMRFRGSKDLHSLIKFYKKTTGFEPVQHVAVDQCISLGSSEKFVMQSWMGSSLNEISRREPILSIFYIVRMSKGTCTYIPESSISFQSFLGIICTSSETGNIWRGKPNIGVCPSHDRCEEGLDQAETMQDQGFP
ncbi:hypothetical protein F0562_016186 [Nyssa sinensis]|uniref:Thioredoxin domain-containing protein n=1 Tax=Nyssa sinensis TaxID=561372 RepID=A0A5J4ZK28_9ASTE|nr:hypothetical protein F0562_016186 [Nyssa sinensis]